MAEADDEGSAVLTELADAGLLLPLSAAPVTAWNAARAWAAASAGCPLQSEEGDVQSLSGPCALKDGRTFNGNIDVDEAPDGGVWRFEAVSVGEDAWDGGVSWIRTDGAHNLSAFDFTAGRSGASVAHSVLAASLSATDAWSSVRGTGRYELDGSAITATFVATAAGDCASAGAAEWLGDAERVTAGLVAPGCQRCSAWEAEGGATGEWCEPNE